MNPSTPPYLNAILSWYPGPANGGGGTAGKGGHSHDVVYWHTDETLLIVIDTNQGREMAIVHITADEDFFIARDVVSGEVYSDWEPHQWSWWAKLDHTNLPPAPHIHDQTAVYKAGDKAVVFGCAQLRLALLREIMETMLQDQDKDGNRTVESVTLNSGKTLSRQQVRSILEYVAAVDKAAIIRATE